MEKSSYLCTSKKDEEIHAKYMLAWIILLVFLAIVLSIPPIVALIVVARRYNRQEHALRDEAEAHRRILEGTYDRIWSLIKQRAGLTEEFRTSFNNIYPDLIDKSINNEQFIDWILDCNPNFAPEEYLPLIESIETHREKFVAHQHRMLEVIKQHRMLVTGWLPSKLIKDRSAISYAAVDVDYARWGHRI